MEIFVPLHVFLVTNKGTGGCEVGRNTSVIYPRGLELVAMGQIEGLGRGLVHYLWSNCTLSTIKVSHNEQIFFSFSSIIAGYFVIKEGRKPTQLFLNILVYTEIVILKLSAM